MATAVTIWARFEPADNKKPARWSFNHIEDGHSLSDTPADPFNRGWKRGKWRKQHGHLGANGPHGAPMLEYDRATLYALANA